MRGCPYKCSYCLSSLDEKVRYRSISKVKEDLKIIFETGTKQIKFVDRSFGVNKDRAIELLEFMRDNDPGDINIHLEMNLENLDEKIINILVESRDNLFQIEAGVQSTNSNVLSRINRKSDISSIAKSMKKLEKGKIHRHLDLIIGLPGEDMKSFFKGFDDLYWMNPERIQVGFLKLLRGTSLRTNAKELGIYFEKEAPYTVIKTKELSGREILYLKTFENIVEVYCDEHKFYHTNKYIIEEKKERPSDYFYALARYYNQNLDKYKINNVKGKYRLLYDYFKSFYEDEIEVLYDHLKMDFYLQEDHFIERILPVDDKEMSKGEVIHWLKQIDDSEYKELGKDIHRAGRMCRGIRFRGQEREVLFLYKNHKYIRHISRPLGGKYE